MDDNTEMVRLIIDMKESLEREMGAFRSEFHAFREQMDARFDSVDARLDRVRKTACSRARF